MPPYRRLLYHVPGDEPVLYLVTGYERVVEDASFEGVKQSLFRTVGYLPHIVEIDRAELVERCGQGLFGRTDVGMASPPRRKRDGRRCPP